MTIELTEVPDYYSREYHYRRYPAKVNGRAGHFAVWSRDVEGPNPNHVTWSPELIAIVAEEYQTAEWKAERAERAARPELTVGDHVRLGDLVVEVPKRAAEYIDSVPCPEVPRRVVLTELSDRLYVELLEAVGELTNQEAIEVVTAVADRVERLLRIARRNELHLAAADVWV